MKSFIKICALLGLLTVHIFSQKINEKKSLPINVSGQWVGSFNLTLPDGKVQHETAVFMFDQKNQIIIGTAGASADRQSPITEGKISGNRLQFKVSVRAGTVLNFNFVFNNNHLKGEATGDPSNAKIEIDVVRVDDAVSVKSYASQNLYDEILQTDQEMFLAFNERRLEKFKRFFSKKLEFYQDLTGLTHYRQNIETFKTNFAKAFRVRRELDLKSLEIYPLKNYGAMEIGTHRFLTTEPGQVEKLAAEVKFVHIWQKRNGVWRITRVISYGH